MRKYILFLFLIFVHWIARGQTKYEYRYWFDGEESTIQTGYINSSPLSLNMDISNLTDGLHLLHMQVVAPSMSSPKSKMFVKLPQTEGIEKMTCLLIVDNNIFKQEEVEAHDGIINWDVDISEMSQGLHKGQFMVVSSAGTASAIKESFFYRAMTTEEKASMKCYYSVDGGNHYAQAGQMDNNLYHFDLDVANIDDGLHKLSYMLMGDNGVCSKVLTNFFFKTPLGGDGITQYEYWLNDRIDNMHTTKLETRTYPLQLIKLLPVEECPIRSSCFHFEATKGKPTVYAKNDFHVRFYDAAGRITEDTRQYIDYNVSQDIDNIEALTNASSNIIKDVPQENGILWYSIDAAIGDSIAIKSDRACTLQIFDQSGNEQYSASGSEAVNFNGFHAYENSTYYIALHDVAGTGSNKIKLEYQHIDKYAVLSHTPNEIGAAPGYVHIKLFGNGYDKLKRAALVYNGDSITSDTVMTEDISNAQLEFFINSTSLTRGKYDIVLEFEENGVKETLNVPEAVNIVDPVYGDIEITIKPQPRTAKPYPVTISIKNTGNVDYQMIPLYIGFDNPDLIDEVTALNFDICMKYDANETGLTTFTRTDNLLGKGVDGFVLPTMIPSLEANSTLDLQIGFVAGPHTKFNMYVWNYKPWSLAAYPGTTISANSKGITPNPMCDINPCDIISNVAPAWMECACGIEWGKISLLSGTYLAIYNKWVKDINNIYGEDLDYYGISRRNTVQLCSPQGIIAQVLDHCDPQPGDRFQLLNDAFNLMAEDGCPNPDPKPIDILMPGDPNDIQGYQAVSGSKFVGKGITDSYYTIEFENDPELANASAHHVIVTDTLDGRYLDLSSFYPTGIKLGNKDIMLDGEQSFVKTIDLRPEINVLAQVTLDYDSDKGVAKWDFVSLDPMTLEFTDDVMMGILPVNYNGEGQGEITFDIKLKNDLPDNVEISNRATIIFDNEAPITTPTWTNITDTIAPVSKIKECYAKNDTTIVLKFEGTDNRSGIWKYDLYAQYGSDNTWIKAAENITDSVYNFICSADYNYGFCIMATDSAGNIESKTLQREASQTTYIHGDANGDGIVNSLDITIATEKYLGNEVKINFEATDMNSDGIINSLDVSMICDTYLSTNVIRNLVKAKRLRIKYE